MRKATRIWLIVAASLVVIGCVLGVSGMQMGKHETNVYEIGQAYKSISVTTKAADVVFVPSEDSKTTVICNEQKKVKHSVTVHDDMLVIKVVDTRKWYEYIGINIAMPKITVSIPQGEYGVLAVTSNTGNVHIPKGFKFESMDVSASTGDIKVEGVSAGDIALSASTGKVAVTDVLCEGDVKVNVSTGKTNMVNVECENVMSDGDTGDLSMKNVIASQKFTIERDTGDVRFEACDASEIFIKTDTGDVTGSLLTDKVFIAQSDTGKVNLPKTTTGGKCEVTTSTGDIQLKIQRTL